jgi:hypothetical protein
VSEPTTRMAGGRIAYSQGSERVDMACGQDSRASLHVTATQAPPVSSAHHNMSTCSDSSLYKHACITISERYACGL